MKKQEIKFAKKENKCRCRLIFFTELLLYWIGFFFCYRYYPRVDPLSGQWERNKNTAEWVQIAWSARKLTHTCLPSLCWYEHTKIVSFYFWNEEVTIRTDSQFQGASMATMQKGQGKRGKSGGNWKLLYCSTIVLVFDSSWGRQSRPWLLPVLVLQPLPEGALKATQQSVWGGVGVSSFEKCFSTPPPHLSRLPTFPTDVQRFSTILPIPSTVALQPLEERRRRTRWNSLEMPQVFDGYP